jgi:hypothetical protein
MDGITNTIDTPDHEDDEKDYEFRLAYTGNHYLSVVRVPGSFESNAMISPSEVCVALHAI